MDPKDKELKVSTCTYFSWSEARIRGSGFVPFVTDPRIWIRTLCHGSTTLAQTLVFVQNDEKELKILHIFQYRYRTIDFYGTQQA